MTLRRLLGPFILAVLTLAGPGYSAADQDTGPVYLVYAGPYSTNPSSAFGHLFLVFQPRADLPLPLWEVVSFSADTRGAGPLRYFTVGITGGFLGTYKTVKFHEQVRDYEVLEDRDLWLVRLRLSEGEHRALRDALAATAGRRYEYLFFSRNCAFYLQQLLARAVPAMPAPSGATSPVGVLRLAIERGLAETSHYRPALSRRLVAQLRELPDAFTGRLRRTGWRELAADRDWLRGLTTGERAFMQEFFNLKLLHQDRPADEATQSGLALLRLLNATTAPVTTDSPAASALGQPRATPAFHRYGKLAVSPVLRSHRAPRLELRYRPALHEFTDPWLGYRPLNTLELLAVTVSGDRAALRLEEFTLFSQRSLSPVSCIAAPASTLLETRVRRGGLRSSRSLHAGIRAGKGLTTALSRVSYAYLLATGAVQGTTRHGVALAPGLQAGAVCLATDAWRFGAQWDYERDLFDWPRTSGRLDAWAHRDLGARWGATVHLRADGEARDLKVDFSRFL